MPGLILQSAYHRRILIGACLALSCMVAVAIWLANDQPSRRPLPPESLPTAELERLPARPGDPAVQRLDPIGADAARALNAATPFAEVNPVPATSFRFAGSPLDRARAADCLAIAALAEAGGSDEGQRAVIQVVLNRVRHPAFTPTVCGVVFQGSLRNTGCQFSFTCDGALARRYGDGAWKTARERAEAALAGRVFAPVGTATHYHTDWVHPVWSAQLDKIARIETHLFFRWKGFWGQRAAAIIPYRGNEPAIAQIAWLPSHASAAIAAVASEAPGEMSSAFPRPGERVKGGIIAGRNPEAPIYLVQLTDAKSLPALLKLGRELCGAKGYCRVWGWADSGAAPAALPISKESRSRLSFSYTLDATNAEYVFYDCRRFEDAPRESCLPRS